MVRKVALETKRLILRPISLSDLDDLFALRSDPDGHNIEAVCHKPEQMTDE